MEETGMEMKEFSEKVRREMEARLGKETEVAEKNKNNGIRLHGLTVKGEIGSIEPVIYLEPFYERYLEAGDWEGTVKDILVSYEMSRTAVSCDMGWLYDYKETEGKLIYRLVNYELNREMLCDVVYERYLDLAKVYCVKCDVEGENGFMVIHKNHLSLWNITEDEIKRAAEKNTPVLMPAKYGKIEIFLRTALEDMMTEQEKESGCLEIWGEPVKLENVGNIGDSVRGMYVLTNEEMVQGAAAICYPGVLGKIADVLKADLAILPSSIHEVILVPAGQNVEDMSYKEMVYEINRSRVPWDEVLSDSVYLYRRDTGETEIV